jgi:hypothetical protein
MPFRVMRDGFLLPSRFGLNDVHTPSTQIPEAVCANHATAHLIEEIVFSDYTYRRNR